MQQQAAREREDATATRAKDRAKEFSQLSTPHLIPGTPFGWSSLGLWESLSHRLRSEKKVFLSFCPWPGYPFFILFLSSTDFSSILEILFLSFFNPFFILLSLTWISFFYPPLIFPQFWISFFNHFFILFKSFLYPPSCKMDQNWLLQVQKAKGWGKV